MAYRFTSLLSVDGTPTLVTHLGTDATSAFLAVKAKLEADGYTVGACYSCPRYGVDIKVVSSAAQALSDGFTVKRFLYDVSVAMDDGYGGETSEPYTVVGTNAVDAGSAVLPLLAAEGKTGLRVVYSSEVIQIHYL